MEISHPVFYFTDVWSNPKLGWTIDLSMGGARIDTPYSLTKGEQLEISILIDPQGIKSKGEVVHVLGSKDQNLMVRIRFAEISNEDRHHLEEYLSSVREQLRASRGLIENDLQPWSPAENLSEPRFVYLLSKALETQERERKLLAQEIHDKIGDPLAAVKFSLQGKLDRIAKNLIPTRPLLEEIVSTIQRIFENVREISTNLRPPGLDHLGILATIHWFCRQFQRIHSGIRLDTQLHIQETDVPESLKIVIYRVLEEVLNNLVKHTKPDHIRISLEEADNSIHLSFEGNGQGFDIDEILGEESSAGSAGPVTMRERVGLSGGVFSAESMKGTGAVIRASWPGQKEITLEHEGLRDVALKKETTVSPPK